MRPNVVFPAGFYRIALPLLLVVLGMTCYHRAIHFDDAWFAEQSYWLLRDGNVRSELFRGYNGWEKQIYVFHKLFIYAGAALTWLPGVSLASCRVLNILCAIGMGALIWQYSRRFSREAQWLSLLLYFGCGVLIRYFAINRPEIMCTMLGFASFLMLDREAGKLRRTALTAFLAGLAALTHLNGLIYLAAGGLWLLLQKDWRSSLVFGTIGGLTLSLYGLDALLDGNFAELIRQFIHDPATQSNLRWAEKLRVMVDYQELFFHSHHEFPLTVLALLCLLGFRYRAASQNNGIRLYLGLLFVVFLLLTKSNFNFYYILFIPWLVLLVAQTATQLLPDRPRWQHRAARVLLITYLGGALLVLGQALAENLATPYAPVYNAQLAKHMPKRQTLVIAPLSFFFGQMENFQIRGLAAYYLREKREGKIPLADFFAEARQNSVEYIISDEKTNASYFIPPDAPSQISAYRRIFQDERTSIYARQR